MKLAVCLITADRAEYTRITIDSFNKFNPGSPRIMKLHVDDASSDPDILDMAAGGAFQYVGGTPLGKPRRGGQAMRQIAVEASRAFNATHILILENDIETVRPLPWDLIDYVFALPDIYCLRLYGTHKERNGQRACGKTHFGKNNKDPGWKDQWQWNEHYQVGDIHWGAQPCITRIDEATYLHMGTASEGQIRKKSGKLDLLTARVMDNVCYHIGADRTEGFKQ